VYTREGESGSPANGEQTEREQRAAEKLERGWAAEAQREERGRVT
jgi:hypothetical protein